MKLYYNSTGWPKTFTLVTVDDEVIDLGQMTPAMLKLQHEYELTESQAREAVLRAINCRGAPVCLDNVKRMASLLIRKD
jgi:hypothetical protein